MNSLEIMQKLVSFDTTSHKSNLDIVEWIESYLKGFDVPSLRVPDPLEPKANLIVSFGPTDIPGYILSGHTDVVPVVGQPWKTEPFTVHLENGRAYGRGTCDMKGFLAVCLALVPEIKAAKLQKPIHFVFTYDEEDGLKGSKVAAEYLRDFMPLQEGCFIGEPTNMQVVTAHKGYAIWRVRVTGLAKHSSMMPSAVSAITYAARLIGKIAEINADLERNEKRDELFDVPHSTLNVGLIEGGAANNIVAQDCAFNFEVRSMPDSDVMGIYAQVHRFAKDILEPEMRKLAPDAGFEFIEIINCPSLSTDQDADVTKLAQHLAQRNDLAKVAYSTDACRFTSIAKIPSIVVGPGSILPAHQPNEYIELSELDKCEAFVRKLVDYLG